MIVTWFYKTKNQKPRSFRESAIHDHSFYCFKQSQKILPSSINLILNMFSSGIRNFILLVILSFGPILSSAQTSSTLKPNWQNLDLTSDSTFGISTEKAYQELLKGKKATPVIVAVIDGGVDINHEDLKDVIYTNPGEKKKINQKDDDKNGYVDDIHGWDFLGGPNGNVQYENLELVRLIRAEQSEFEGKDPADIPADRKEAYEKYLDMKADLQDQLADAQQNLNGIAGFKKILEDVVSKIGVDNPTVPDFEAFKPEGPAETQIKKVMLNVLKEGLDFKQVKKDQIDAAYDHYNEQVKYNLNIDYNPRSIVGDDVTNDKERIYGNNDVIGPDAFHGTHVAGIIGAERDNDLGVKGVADHVWIMSVRTVPSGDERDKDVANAIRYAADNGAKVINMSFGKGYSQDKKVVDEAVKYAISKDVLLVHAAGNDNKNLELEDNFPNRKYEDKSGLASAWIEVGASGPVNDESLKASFSNYGKTAVDVFAPGVNINSTTPNSTYQLENGTSMASPVVAGLAALIRSYYPKFTALQVKDIIMKSVVKVNHPVNVMVDKQPERIPFSQLCMTGGIVNTYNALKFAETMSKSLSAVN